MSIEKKLDEIVNRKETRAGRAFDLWVLGLILLSVAAVVLESVSEIRMAYGPYLRAVEWVLTGCFTLEYILRVFVTRPRGKYVFSFFGLIDLLATLPSYLQMFLPVGQSFLILRIFRLLRIFRIFKLARYLSQAAVLKQALLASREKVVVFLGSVLILVTLMGTIMYLIEGEANGFTSIPRSIYWAIVTMTTVGYGDVVPKTVIGQSLSALVMITGYCILAVPTGIVTMEINQAVQRSRFGKCGSCEGAITESNALYCFLCGEKL